MVFAGGFTARKHPKPQPCESRGMDHSLGCLL